MVCDKAVSKEWCETKLSVKDCVYVWQSGVWKMVGDKVACVKNGV